MTRTNGTPGEAAPVEAELLTDEELEHLYAVELVDEPLDEFADLITAADLRRMRREVPG